jgi:hypothetical protein
VLTDDFCSVPEEQIRNRAGDFIGVGCDCFAFP